jgi:hypothetical protein
MEKNIKILSKEKQSWLLKFTTCKLFQIFSACGMHGRGEKRVQGFGVKAQGKKDHLEDQGVDGRTGVWDQNGP